MNTNILHDRAREAFTEHCDECDTCTDQTVRAECATGMRLLAILYDTRDDGPLCGDTLPWETWPAHP